ncbi:hypothetical protein BSKO_03677 [Bryopsis sp. KO-2023]|nr:hypothetical protein BSKO_03677 [Bryopsis sp. KO-2023]
MRSIGTRRSTRLAAKRALDVDSSSPGKKGMRGSSTAKRTKSLHPAGPSRNRSTVVECKGGKEAKVKLGPTFDVENGLWAGGHRLIAGVDEAGRGPLAGPVVAAACILSPNVSIPGIDDSKKITEAKREEIYEAIIGDQNIVYASCVIDAGEIDKGNILQATMSAMEGAVKKLVKSPDYILVDGNRLPDGFDAKTSEAIVKGDAKCMSIAAASIIAKVERDRMMIEYDRKWPQYGFAKHKGYGTVLHMKAIEEHGPCPIHRMTFKPLSLLYPDEKHQ